MASEEDVTEVPFKLEEVESLMPMKDKAYSFSEIPDKIHWSQTSNDSTADRKIRFGYQEEPEEETSPPPEYTFRPSIRLSNAVPRMECENFLNFEEFSSIFVDKIIKEATTNQEVIASLIQAESEESVVEESSKTSTSTSTSTSTGTNKPGYGAATVFVIEWPSVIEFDQELGVTKIDDFLSYWYLENEWKYCVFFRRASSDGCSDFYEYEAIFSVPCKQYPVPQATASVYFTVEASRVKPKYCPVEVYYRFEGKRLLHTPSSYEFQESWLFDIIDAKIKLFQCLNF